VTVNCKRPGVRDRAASSRLEDHEDADAEARKGTEKRAFYSSLCVCARLGRDSVSAEGMPQCVSEMQSPLYSSSGGVGDFSEVLRREWRSGGEVGHSGHGGHER